MLTNPQISHRFVHTQYLYIYINHPKFINKMHPPHPRMSGVTARTASTLIFASWSLRLLTTCPQWTPHGPPWNSMESSGKNSWWQNHQTTWRVGVLLTAASIYLSVCLSIYLSTYICDIYKYVYSKYDLYTHFYGYIAVFIFHTYFRQEPSKRFEKMMDVPTFRLVHQRIESVG